MAINNTNRGGHTAGAVAYDSEKNFFENVQLRLEQGTEPGAVETFFASDRKEEDIMELYRKLEAGESPGEFSSNRLINALDAAKIVDKELQKIIVNLAVTTKRNVKEAKTSTRQRGLLAAQQLAQQDRSNIPIKGFDDSRNRYIKTIRNVGGQLATAEATSIQTALRSQLPRITKETTTT